MAGRRCNRCPTLVDLFAYGTLMTAEGLRAALGDRADTFRYRVARLPGWRRIWNVYREEWSGVVLNLERHPGAVVVGVLIEGLSFEDLSALDSQESTHARARVTVAPDAGAAAAAEVYWRAGAGHEGPPSDTYLLAVRARARACGPAVLSNLLEGSVDSRGAPLRLG